MGNVVDYVRREFHGFAELPFGDVDSLVLAELSYMRLSGLVPAFGEARSVATVPIRELLRAESYDDMFVSNSSDINEYRLALLRAVFHIQGRLCHLTRNGVSARCVSASTRSV